MKFYLLLISSLIFSFGFGQIPPGYYDNANGLSGTALKSALHDIIKNHTEYPYSQTDEILRETDEDPANPNNVILVYTGRSQAKSTFGGNPNDWNREHVWAKSHGGFGDSPPCGTDIHHMKPSDASVNADRGNKDFDNGGVQHPEATECFYDADSWEPRDDVKGDIARIIFYMSVRYEGDNGEPDLEVVDWVNSAPAPEHGKFSALLEWNTFDPPDAFEINRNNVIYSYQQNRNPFIDHPEYVNMIWNPASVQEERFYSKQINVYPVPANNFVTLSPELPPIDQFDLFIYSSYGQEIFSQKNISTLTFPMEINTQDIANGLYFIEFVGERYTITKKLQIIH
jgi:endonuclease I